MKSRQYSLAFLAATLLVTLTKQSSSAFTITFHPSVDPSSVANYYLSDGSQGTVQTALVSSLTLGGTMQFIDKLEETFPTSQGWIFNPASQDLEGSFEIRTYYANVQGNPPGVGSQFQLFYNPAGSDPTPAGNQLHWIQRVVNNHNLTNNPGHGNNEDVIDVPLGQTNPFYDLIPGISFTDEDDFADGPTRPDPWNEHTWFAELHLVEIPDPVNAPKTVTIYNGISWGWRNTVTPPNTGGGCNGSSGGGGCAGTFVSQELPLSDGVNASQSPYSVPEPISTFGLLGLGAWGVFQGLKIRKNK